MLCAQEPAGLALSAALTNTTAASDGQTPKFQGDPEQEIDGKSLKREGFKTTVKTPWETLADFNVVYSAPGAV